MYQKKIIEIIEFTDPVCTWCWGSEPIIRKLETRFDGDINIKYVMGGLVKDIREFYDSYNGIGKDPELSNFNIAKHWLEASNRHGMPVMTEGFCLFTDEFPSTYPQNIAYKAAQMENEELANKLLRRIREATTTEAKQTNRVDILIELVSEVGLDVNSFLKHMNDGSAESAFYNDLLITKNYGVRGFPAFLIRYGEREVMIRSFQNYEAFKSVIFSLVGGEISEKIPERSEESILYFIKKYGRVALVEIQECFEITNDETQKFIDLLVKEGKCRVIEVGNGSFIEIIENPMFCDPVSGVCSF